MHSYNLGAVHGNQNKLCNNFFKNKILVCLEPAFGRLSSWSNQKEKCLKLAHGQPQKQFRQLSIKSVINRPKNLKTSAVLRSAHFLGRQRAGGSTRRHGCLSHSCHLTAAKVEAATWPPIKPRASVPRVGSSHLPPDSCLLCNRFGQSFRNWGWEAGGGGGRGRGDHWELGHELRSYLATYLFSRPHKVLDRCRRFI